MRDFIYQGLPNEEVHLIRCKYSIGRDKNGRIQKCNRQALPRHAYCWRHLFGLSTEICISILSCIVAVLSLIVTIAVFGKANQIAQESNYLSETAVAIAVRANEPGTVVTTIDTPAYTRDSCSIYMNLTNFGGAADILVGVNATASLLNYQVPLWGEGADISSFAAKFFPGVSDLEAIISRSMNSQSFDDIIKLPYRLEAHDTLDLWAEILMNVSSDLFPFAESVPPSFRSPGDNYGLADINITFTFYNAAGDEIVSPPGYCTSIEDPDKK